LITTAGMHTVAQAGTIGLGWARNSVNAPVFRKNSVASYAGMQYTAYYDSVGNVILAKRKTGSETWDTLKTHYKGNVEDAHCSISIAVDGNGFLHMAWDHHNDALRYCMSVDPGSVEMGEEQVMTGDQEDDVTYPEFFRLPNGDLLFIYRYGVSGNGNMVINKYLAEEKRWIRLHNNLISGQNQRNAYWQSCVDVNGVIHVSWVWRETWDVATNHDMCYARSPDGGVNWYKSTGEKYSIPVTLSTAEYACKISQNKELINQTSMYADAESRPYIVSYWEPAGSNTPQYHLVYLNDSSEWETFRISNRTTSFSLSGGGTKKIPISRPQVVVNDRDEQTAVYMVYRDVEHDSKVSVNVCYNLEADTTRWFEHDLTLSPVDSWEPSYDTDLWKDSLKLDIFVQRMGQGDGETQEDLPPQPVYILRMPEVLDNATDSFDVAKTVREEVTAGSHMNNADLCVYPNPVMHNLGISGEPERVRLNVFNINGDLVRSESVESLPAEIDVASLQTGVYLLYL